MRILFSLLLPLAAVLMSNIPKEPITIDSAKSQLNQYSALQKQLNIQDADLAYAMRKALVMADLLVNADGQLNLALCPALKSAFISPTPEEYEVNMTKMLGQLDASWQTFFDGVKAPVEPQALVLRALFSLGPHAPITDRHAKVAVLAAMLGPYNQGPVGDCFAVNDVIRDHTEYHMHMAEDCASIVMNGYVSRPVNGTEDYFFFLPILADGDSDRPFTITAEGKLSGTNDSIFDAPGFAAARSLMGGDAMSGLEEAILKSLFADHKADQIQVTPSQLLKVMAQAIAASDDLYALGAYAFSSLTNNPILRAVESAFAAMAEDRATDSTRGNINTCVTQALKSTWEQLGDKASQFQKAFAQVFNNSYRLLYNLNIPLPQVSADGSSTDGGFQLYQRTADPKNLGTRVATPQHLRQLILDAVTNTAATLGSSSNAIASHLKSVIETEDFLKNVLWDYDPSNKKVSDPVQNYLKLSRSPMQSCDGDNPFEVDDIDTQIAYDNKVQSYTPHNTMDLINWCMKLAKIAPAEMIPMDSPQHAFNFMPANPDLAKYLQTGVDASQWIQKNLVVPGMQVAKRAMDAKTAQALGAQIHQFIANVLSNEQGYQDFVDNLAKQNLNIQEYSQKFLSGLDALLHLDQDQAHQLALGFDSMLLQLLPATDQAILEQSAIRFAFTNWNEGTKDIYFCAFFNPRTEQVAFGTIFEDKTNLQPMDENAWVNNQQWDVDLSPFAPKDLAAAM